VILCAADANVPVIGTFPARSHSESVCPAARLAAATGDAEARFYEALSAAPAVAIFEGEGFTLRD